MASSEYYRGRVRLSGAGSRVGQGRSCRIYLSHTGEQQNRLWAGREEPRHLRQGAAGVGRGAVVDARSDEHGCCQYRSQQPMHRDKICTGRQAAQTSLKTLLLM